VVLRVSWVTGIFLGVWGGRGSVWEVTKQLVMLVPLFCVSAFVSSEFLPCPESVCAV
jgi:hypothetical protein